MLSDTAPFYAGSTISEPKYFVGYREQLDIITARAINVQPTSLNVVGDKRIGKSSLLQHFCQTYEQRIESRGDEPNKYLAVYLDLQQVNCQRKSSFYKVVTEELRENLKKRYSWFGQPRRLIKALSANSFDTENFNQAIFQFHNTGILPILCLDKVEALFKHPEEFNNDFYDNLRSLMGYRGGALMFVIASEKNIEIYRRQKKLTSTFFIDAHVMMLEGFTDNEARDLVRLPQTTIPGSRAVLNENQQQTALEWGGKNPYLLQLAGLYLWEARQSNKDINWAKKRFDRQARGVSTNYSIWRKCLLLLKWVFWHLPVKLGQAVKFIGTTLDELSAWVLGVFIVGILILAASGILNWESVIEAVKNALGLGG